MENKAELAVAGGKGHAELLMSGMELLLGAIQKFWKKVGGWFPTIMTVLSALNCTILNSQVGKF